jgi:hypothetical protein
MEREPSVWRIALGTMAGNIGCAIVYLLFSCVALALLSIMGGSISSIFSRVIGGLGP